jgi:hypothetical protein
VFLVESAEGHKDAVLLLDEPGLHLHPTAQQELIQFFEEVSKKNQIVYTTHSPFLIDGEHIHRVRPVMEDQNGHSRVLDEGWPDDRDTIFPLQAAAGYQMMKSLFAHHKNVLVEGLSDYIYLHGLSLLLGSKGRATLPADVYLTPCGGTKMVSPIASLFLAEKVRPLVLLDADQQGEARRNSLLNKLYSGHDRAVLMLSEPLKMEACEIEDVLGEQALIPVVSALAGQKLQLSAADRAAGSLPDQIQAAAIRKSIELPETWRPEAARRVVTAWAQGDESTVSDELLERAEAVIQEITTRVAEITLS